MDEAEFESALQRFIDESARDRPEFEGRFFRYPFLHDDTETTGYDTHYVYHVAWALRKLVAAKPTIHIDFSSSINFCTAASAICETQFYDFRPASIFLDGLTCLKADLTDLPMQSGSLASVSCMHVIEHIGLGRYGDELDASGDLKAIEELKRVVSPGGSLYIVVPTGAPGLYFNAHRVYAAAALVAYFEDQCDLVEFYFIPGPIESPPLTNPELSETRSYEYGCGCYRFRKR